MISISFRFFAERNGEIRYPWKWWVGLCPEDISDCKYGTAAKPVFCGGLSLFTIMWFFAQERSFGAYYSCISFDFPERRIPGMILMSEVPFGPMILFKCLALVIVFILPPLSKMKIFLIFETVGLRLLFYLGNSICNRTNNAFLPQRGHWKILDTCQ